MSEMDRSVESLSGTPPSLLLMGMRGAGKTTLGRLASEHLRVPFIDADELFSQRYAPHTAKTYVAEHGWPAFRAEETKLLVEILGQIQQEGKAMVVSLGGGIVEEEINRKLLKNCWCSESSGQFDRSKRIAVVHIFREVDNVLLDVRGLPSWGVANGHEVWERRRPFFREASSHEFVNFTDAHYLQAVHAETSRAARLQFEAVERDFVSFLIRFLKVYEPNPAKFEPSKGERSYLATFPFSDLHPHVKKLPRLTLGVDAVELRADLLRDPMARSAAKIVEAYENPSLSYLSEQVALIRRHLPSFPLVFTLRTPSQGGRYPYPADAPAEALFKSLHHALKLGCDMIDIEMGLDPQLTETLIQDAKERNISVLISWRDKTPPNQGGFSWSSARAKALYDEARQMGADVVKIVGTAGQVSDNFALRVFAASIEDWYEGGEEEEEKEEEEENSDDKDQVHHKGTNGTRTTKPPPPLSAYNMGYKGRISRFLNPTLASVTHDVAKQLTGKGVIGNPSMTFSEIQRALHLSGLLEKKSFIHLCSAQTTSAMERDWMSIMYKDWFDVMGLPYSMDTCVGDGKKLKQIIDEHEGFHGDLQGVLVGEGMDVVSQVVGDANVKATGYCDTVILGPSGSLLGFNKLVDGLYQLIRSSISPSVHLNKHSSAIVLASSTTTSFAKTGLQAIRCLGLDNVVILGPPFSTSVLAAKGKSPTVIVDTCEDATKIPFETYRQLLSGQDGGLFVDLFNNDRVKLLIQEEQYKQMGWRYIGGETVSQQTNSLRFWHFTGRRAPLQQ